MEFYDDIEMDHLIEMEKFKIFDPRRVLVLNIPVEYRNRKILKRLFSECGEIDEIELMQSSAIICFTEKESALETVENLEFIVPANVEIDNGCTITLDNLNNGCLLQVYSFLFEYLSLNDMFKLSLVSVRQKFFFQVYIYERYTISPFTLDILDDDCILHIHSYLSLDDIYILFAISPHQQFIYMEYEEMEMPFILDYLNDDCLFHIYSYLSFKDICNLSEASERQGFVFRDCKKISSKNRVEDLTSKFIEPIKVYAFQIITFLSKFIKNFGSTKPTELVRDFHLRSEENYNSNVELNNESYERTIKMNLFDFAYLMVDEFYIIEANFPNLETLCLFMSDIKLILCKVDIAQRRILSTSMELIFIDMDFVLKEFIPTKEVREHIELLLNFLDKQIQTLEKLGEIDSFQKLNCIFNCFHQIYVLTNNIDCMLHSDPESKEKPNVPLTPFFTYNFQFLSESNLGKHLKILEIDLDFFGMTHEHMECFAKFKNLKKLGMSCRKDILESAEFLAAMEQLVKYNNLEILILNINLLDRNDDSGRFLEKFKLKFKKMLMSWLKCNKFKKSLSLTIRNYNKHCILDQVELTVEST